MATYRSIVGHKINKVSSDPAEPLTGQMWYNSTTGTLRGLGILEAFTSSSNVGTARYSAMWAGEGTQNATLFAAGRSGAPAVVALTEEYNGSGWSAGGNCNNAENSAAGFGTQTATVKSGGYPGSGPTSSNESEEYDGSSWTSGNNINPQRQGHSGAGVLTAGVIFGGNDGTILNKTEEYDGTNFSNVNNMNTARENLSGVGIQTAALAAGGANPGPTVKNSTESYDGTNWTTLANINTARRGLGGFGDTSNSVITGGAPYTAVTETWDGTSWSTSPATLATARVFFGDAGAGSSTAGIVASGQIATGRTAVTEEYNKSINTITAAAWSSGGAYPTDTVDVGSAGTRTAGLIFSGETPAPAVTQATNEYNGSTFSGGGLSRC